MSWLYSFFKKSANGASVLIERAAEFTASVIMSGAVTISGALTASGAMTSTGGITATGTVKINGVTFSAYAGTPEAHVTGTRKGDVCLDYTNGAMYIFAGTAAANTGWKLVTQAE